MDGQILPQLSNFLNTDWSRAMFDTSTVHGKPWKWWDGGTICFFLFLACPLPQETSMEMDVKTFNVTVKNKLTTIFHSLYSDQPFL